MRYDEVHKAIIELKENLDSEEMLGYMQAAIEAMEKVKGPKKIIWKKICESIDDNEIDWVDMYLILLEEYNGLEEDWKKVLVWFAEVYQKIEPKTIGGTMYLTKEIYIEGSEDGEEQKSITESDLGTISGPKQKHEKWTGGGLAMWMGWCEDFMDLSTEFKYSEEVKIRRLKKHTLGADEYAIVVMLSTEGMKAEIIMETIAKQKVLTHTSSGVKQLKEVQQDNRKIEKYFHEFVEATINIELTNGVKLTDREKIEAFDEGLSSDIKRRIPFWSELPDNGSFREHVESIMKMEAQMVKYGDGLKAKRRKKKSKRRSSRKAKTDEASRTMLVCREYQRNGSCRFGKKCKFIHGSRTKTDEKKWIEPCWFQDNCKRKSCRFYHKKKRTMMTMDEESSEDVNTSEESEEESEELSEYESEDVTLMMTNTMTLGSGSKSSNRGAFWWDSGCSSSQTYDKSIFSGYREYQDDRYTIVGDNGRLKVEGWGVVAVTSESTGKEFNIIMDFVPELGFNLISNSQMDNKGMKTSGGNGKIKFRKDGKTWMTARLRSKMGLYEIDLKVRKIDEGRAKTIMERIGRSTSLASKTDDPEKRLLIAHKRCGHLNTRDLLYMCKKQLIEGMETFEKITYRRGEEIVRSCEACRATKPVKYKKLRRRDRKSKPKDEMKVEEKEDVINADEKCITLSTDFCGPLPESIMEKKYVCVSIAKEIGLIKIECFPKKTGIMPMVNGFKDYLEGYGYKVKRHESDDGKEFKTNELKKFCREKGIELYYGTGYDSNANAHAERAIRTVFEIARAIMKEKGIPDLLRDYVFRFVEYIRNNSYSRWKKGIAFTRLTGERPSFDHLYICGSLAWARRPKSRYKKLESRQVRAMYIGPGQMLQPRKKGAVFLEIDKIHDGFVEEDVLFTTRRYEVYEKEHCGIKEHLLMRSRYRGNDIKPGEKRMDEKEEMRNDDNEELRRSKRIKKTRAITEEDYGMWTMIQIDIRDAMKGDNNEQWKEAMRLEMKSIIDMGTRELIDKNSFQNIKENSRIKLQEFKTRFILDFKEFEKRYKARLVVTSWMWKEARKDEFYSPVVDEATFFLLINIAVHKRWKIESWDAKNAFLHGSIPEEYDIYVHPPTGWDEGYVWRLRKALYGLPIASKLWFEEICRTMEEAKWTQSRFDKCCFIKIENENMEGLCIVHVDDFQVTGNKRFIKKLKKVMFGKYSMKDVGFGRYCGMNINREKGNGFIEVDMKDYIQKLYTRFDEPRLRNTPYQEKNIKNMEPGKKNGKEMREITGALLFIAKVRPDIKYITSFFCSFNDKYSDDMLKETKRIIGYLKKTENLTLRINPRNMILEAAFDSDFAGCSNSRRSRNGHVWTLGGSYLRAKSKKQLRNTNSSTYAETKCLVDGSVDIIYYRNFLKELKFEQVEPTVILQDNLQTIRIIENQGNQARARGFDIDFHMVQDYVKHGRIRLEKIEGKNMIADALNKPVGKNILENFKRRIGLEISKIGRAQNDTGDISEIPEMNKAQKRNYVK